MNGRTNGHDSERVLTEAQVAQFYNDGYIVIKDFFNSKTRQALLQRARDLIAGFDLSSHPLTRFATGESDHVGDDYFLSSGDKIRFFFEEDAFNPEGKLTRPKEQAINKVGHALHELDDLYRAFSLQNDRLKQVARDLHYHRDPRVLQSMIICKQPRIGGKVPSHDDSTFLWTEPNSALGFWFALEDCRQSNGCLSFLPGSHKLNEPIAKRFVRRHPSGKGGTTFENNASEAELVDPKRDWDGPLYADKWRVEECDAGALVIIDGAVIHRSERNLSDKSRFIYTFHMIDGPDHVKHDERNWLQPTREMPFARLFG